MQEVRNDVRAEDRGQTVGEGAPLDEATATVKRPAASFSPPPLGWTIDTSPESRDEGIRDGLVTAESSAAFAKLTPTGPVASFNVVVVGRAVCRGCGQKNEFTVSILGTPNDVSGSQGIGCEFCDCWMRLGYQDDHKGSVWVAASMSSIAEPRYDLQMTIDRIDIRSMKKR